MQYSLRQLKSVLTFLLAFFCASGSLFAQEGDPLADTVSALPGVEVRTSVDPPSAYIGDPITYVVTITYDSTYELIPPPLGANLGAFDVKDYNADYDSVLADGRRLNETRFILTTFTTGDYIIPPVPITFKRADGSRSIFLSEPVPITIISLLANVTDTPDIRPLKPLVVVPNQTWYWWTIAGGAVLILAAILFFLFRNKQQKGFVDSRTPWEIAYAELAQLEQQSLIADQKYREFYGQMTDLTKQYLGALYHSNIPDMTTDEIASWLNHAPRLEKWREDISIFLKSADLYKFAKVIPGTDRPTADFAFGHGLIGELRDEHLTFLAAERRKEEESRRAGNSSQVAIQPEAKPVESAAAPAPLAPPAPLENVPVNATHTKSTGDQLDVRG